MAYFFYCAFCIKLGLLTFGKCSTSESEVLCPRTKSKDVTQNVIYAVLLAVLFSIIDNGVLSMVVDLTVC